MFLERRPEMAVRKGVSLSFFSYIYLFGVNSVWLQLLFRKPTREDSNHYVAQDKPQGYPCPGCGFSIPMENISANIRTKTNVRIAERYFLALLKLQQKRSLDHNKVSHTKDQKFLGEDIILTLNTKTRLITRSKILGK